MVILYIPEPNLPVSLGWTHDATTWLLATSPTFEDSSIVASSVDDTTNLLSITFDYDMLPDVTYYSKARVITNKSIFESDVSVIKVSDFIKISFDNPIPSLVTKPQLTLSHDNSDFPASLFSITTTPLSTTSNAKHESTSYIIETLDGIPVYSKLFSKDDLTYKEFSDVILDSKQIYRIKVSHHSTSGDVSDFAEEIINVKDVTSINTTSTLENVDASSDFNFVLSPINNYKEMKIELYAVGFGDSELVYEYTTDSLNKIIPSTVFESSKTLNYIIKVTVTLNDDSILGTRYFKLTTI